MLCKFKHLHIQKMCIPTGLTEDGRPTAVQLWGRAMEYDQMYDDNLSQIISLVFTLNLVFSKKYNKIDYFTYEKKYFNKFKKKFSLKYIHNLHDLKMLRYSVIMTLK